MLHRTCICHIFLFYLFFLDGVHVLVVVVLQPMLFLLFANIFLFFFWPSPLSDTEQKGRQSKHCEWHRLWGHALDHWMILQSIALWLHCIAMPCFFSSFFFLSISLSFSVLGCNWGLPFLSFQLAWKELLSFFLALQFCVGEDSLKVYCFCNGFRFTTSARAAQWLFGCLGLLSPIYANVFCQITT